MRVTKVKPIWVKPNSLNVLGEFDVTLDGVLRIHKMCVVRGKKGTFVSFPTSGSRVEEDGRKKYFDIVHPVDSATRTVIVDAVMECFNAEVEKQA